MTIIDMQAQIVRICRHIDDDQVSTEATIYTKGRSGPRLVRRQYLSPATLAAMGGRITAHFEATDDGQVWHIGKRVSDLPW